jgi:hypothetical protein
VLFYPSCKVICKTRVEHFIRFTLQDIYVTLPLQNKPKQTWRGHWKNLVAGTFRMQSTPFHKLCWTSPLVRSSITHSLSTKPALQGFGSVPGGSVYATTRVIHRFYLTGLFDIDIPAPLSWSANRYNFFLSRSSARSKSSSAIWIANCQIFKSWNLNFTGIWLVGLSILSLVSLCSLRYALCAYRFAIQYAAVMRNIPR